ncbi:hypothetical protein CDO52_26320 [Nocardiopsis gilva YIM 90087]|uniref:DUF4429 domain-containing protein n=1 Tax=Nocardiopsis gilva YIM 90087 TaxID=1235441 RepID=A0A223SCH0_9ACTN|nr:DUF4429 domain-containing protein [Nocardiopsis gilva]ASU85848.1 hypothetical protein CDO52_26320 [Nocardiopsis gilva YIM 90087]
MDELRGRQATWRFDGETVAIRYNTGWLAHPLLKDLVQCDVPVAAIASVEFSAASGRGKKWQLRLRLRDRADPFAAVGAMLSEDAQPFRLTGDAATALVAEYYGDQLTFSVNAARDADEGARSARAPEEFALGFVPPLPLHIQTSEGTASFDGRSLRLGWSGDAKSSKRKAQRREFDLGDIRQVEWVPSDGWNEGYLRVVPRNASEEPPTKPRRDLCCLISESKKEIARSLLMAATVTAHLWAARGPDAINGIEDPSAGAGPAPAPPLRLTGPDAEAHAVYDRIRELGRLHAEGLLTDDEFQTKKAELLERL